MSNLFSDKPLHCLEESPGGPWAHRNVFVALSLHFVLLFLMTPVAISLKVPAGVFMPCFIMGATLGRLVGEIVNVIFPEGITHLAKIDTHTCLWDPESLVMKYWYPQAAFDMDINRTVVEATQEFCRWNTTTGTCEPFDTTQCFSIPFILPGAYALVGAAAFAGAVTHSIAACVIILELTGQIRLLLPMMLAILLGNAIAAQLSPGYVLDWASALSCDHASLLLCGGCFDFL